jgi:hypothetical protein
VIAAIGLDRRKQCADNPALDGGRPARSRKFAAELVALTTDADLPIDLSHACNAAELIAAHCVIPDEKHTKNEIHTRQHEEARREVIQKTHSPRGTELEAVPQAECGREAQAGG